MNYIIGRLLRMLSGGFHYSSVHRKLLSSQASSRATTAAAVSQTSILQPWRGAVYRSKLFWSLRGAHASRRRPGISRCVCLENRCLVCFPVLFTWFVVSFFVVSAPIELSRKGTKERRTEFGYENLNHFNVWLWLLVNGI